MMYTNQPWNSRERFDRDMNSRTFNWLFRIVVGVIVIVVIGQLAFYASAAAVLYHFIAKFW